MDSRLCATREASSGDRPGTPRMQVGVRRAFGPPGRSFSLLYSLHGGARVIRLMMPDHEMRKSNSKHSSSSMSCSELASRSKASNRERPCLSAECCRQWDRTVRRSGRNGPRTVSGAIGKMLRGHMRLLAAFYGANMRELPVVCFAQALLESAADRLALMCCCPIVADLPLSPSFPLFLGRFRLVRLGGWTFARSCWIRRSLGELRC